MGHKVHPFGFRLGVIFDWKSRWFFTDKNLYRRTVISDIKIRDFIFKNYAFAAVCDVEIERDLNKLRLIIHSVRPGMIIGREGKGLEELRKRVMQILKESGEKIDKGFRLEIKIEPVKKPYLNARFVAQSIAEKLVKNFPHRPVVHFAIDRVIEAGAKGVKVRLAGRIGGAEIARQEKYSKGTVPTSTIRVPIDYADYPALTKSGYVGVKVWIAKE